MSKCSERAKILGVQKWPFMSLDDIEIRNLLCEIADEVDQLEKVEKVTVNELIAVPIPLSGDWDE